MGSVGCESTAAVHLSPSFCPIAGLWDCKSGKNYPRWGRSRYRRPKPDSLLEQIASVVHNPGKPLALRCGTTAAPSMRRWPTTDRTSASSSASPSMYPINPPKPPARTSRCPWAKSCAEATAGTLTCLQLQRPLAADAATVVRRAGAVEYTASPKASAKGFAARRVGRGQLDGVSKIFIAAANSVA